MPMTLEFAQAAASQLIDWLEPDITCARIVVAGSVRRKKPEPNDIELVLEPAFQTTLFGETAANLFDEQCRKLLNSGIIEQRVDVNGRPRWGERTKLAVFYHKSQPVNADIFSVIEPAQWGTILSIRTGPGEFNKALVQYAHTVKRKVAEGQVWNLSGLKRDEQYVFRLPSDKFVRWAKANGVPVIPTPTEGAYFAALGIPCWPPEDRTEARLKGFLYAAKKTQELSRRKNFTLP